MPLIKSLLSLSLLAALVGTAFAQSGNDKLSDAERARRDADKVFSFIKFHTVKPAAAAKPAAPAPAPMAAAKPAPRVAAAPAAGSNVAAAAPAALATSALSAPAAAANIASNVAAAPVAASASQAAVPAAAAPAVATTLPPATEPAPATEAAAPPALEEDDEVPLKLIAYVAPEMTAQVMAAINGPQVVVPVRFIVQPDGRVSEARSLGNVPRRVANAAVRAVQQWRFEPIPAVREVDVELAFKPSE